MVKHTLTFKASSWKQHRPFLLTLGPRVQVTSRSKRSIILPQAPQNRARVFVHGLNDY